MRIIAEIPHPQCKITIFSWNAKYLVKLEQGPLEQTFKINQLDVAGDEAIRKIVGNEAFMKAALTRFNEMRSTLASALENA